MVQVSSKLISCSCSSIQLRGTACVFHRSFVHLVSSPMIIGNTDSKNRVTRCKRTCDRVLSTWILCTLLSSIAEKLRTFRRIFQNLCEFNKDWKSLKTMSSDGESRVVVAASKCRRCATEEGKEKLCLGTFSRKRRYKRRNARIVTTNLKPSLQILLVYCAIWSICIQT